MSDIQSMAAEIAQDADESADEVEARLDKLHNEYRVPFGKAVTQVRNDLDAYEGGEDELVAVADIDEDELWCSLEVEVVDLWEPTSESIAQVGLLGDESGTIKFTSFKSTDGLPVLEEGESYAFDNVISDEYEGDFSVKLNSSTDVEHRPEMDVDVPDSGRKHTGTVVNVGSGSGLIKRCSEDDCNRVLNNGRCTEHGEVEGEFDLRVKATLDDGLNTPTAIFDAEATTELTGITLDEAEEMAMDALDTSVVEEQVKEEIRAMQITVEGREYDNDGSSTIMVNEFEVSEGVTAGDIEDALIDARSGA